ncbi:RraA family protein [Bradyrhizobium sp. C9]|uniref:RraA family protein n=1 Tax=Bradyrhizobium sp. C9 TaxID=142585 RepID=UPI000BE80E94|nr:RraA family protein [Bradyrhizobium sp. C9]PDT76076.1 methyltransferase [Bradyrhizobium sp. C9]
MAIGFAIHKAKRNVSPDLVARYRTLPVANISDVMSRIAGTNRLRPMHAGGWLGGPALTVKTRPGDNLMVHKAIDLAQPGDVIVVDAGGVLVNAIIGEIMSTLAEKKGVAGFVIDGSIRDAGAIRAGSFPVFAAGVAHRGPYKDGPGEINCAISIDGMIVEPGDLIVADDDGVLCVPHDDAEAVCKLTEAKKATEEKAIQQILAGTSDRRWVDEALQRLGCEFKD